MIQIVLKCRPSFTKSPNLVLIRLVLPEIQPFENVTIYEEMYGHPDARAPGLCDTEDDRGWISIHLVKIGPKFLGDRPRDIFKSKPECNLGPVAG